MFIYRTSLPPPSQPVSTRCVICCSTLMLPWRRDYISFILLSWTEHLLVTILSNSVAWVRYKLYRPSDRRLSAKLVPTLADRGCHVVSVTDPYCRILGYLHWCRYFCLQVAPQLYSRGCVDPVPDPLLLRKSGSAGNRTRISGSVARNSDH
jgi:hypothetical protein